jgi:hypothetical protein
MPSQGTFRGYSGNVQVNMQGTFKGYVVTCSVNIQGYAGDICGDRSGDMQAFYPMCPLSSFSGICRLSKYTVLSRRT